jgi:hypothetical protein
MQRGSHRRVGRLIALVLGMAIGSGGTAAAYQAFAVHPSRSRTPIPERIAPAASRIGSNLNPTGDCSRIAPLGSPFPC